jgi:four helix bundle protein
MGDQLKKFEELRAWQAARELVREIYAATRKSGFTNDFRLSAQIQAAAVSISSNIAEGFERGSSADFHKFLVMAKASCTEVRSQLYNAKDMGYLSEEDFTKLLNLSEGIGRMVGALREAVRRRIKTI